MVNGALVSFLVSGQLRRKPDMQAIRGREPHHARRRPADNGECACPLQLGVWQISVGAHDMYADAPGALFGGRFEFQDWTNRDADDLPHHKKSIRSPDPCSSVVGPHDQPGTCRLCGVQQDTRYPGFGVWTL